jgi:hypothetical protein
MGAGFAAEKVAVKVTKLPAIFRTIMFIVGLSVLSQAFVSCLPYDTDPARVADNCENQVRKSVNPGVLQAWATNLLAQYTIGDRNYIGPFAPPDYLKSIWRKKPPTVYIHPEGRGEEVHVRIFWAGGGMGHWGLLVGGPTFVPKSYGEEQKKWKDGLYFYRDFR